MTLSAAGGFLNHQGDRDRPPLPIGFPETANHGAVQAAADAITAIYERERSGLGQHLDTSMQAAVVGTLLWTASYAAVERNPTFSGDDRADGPSDRGGEVVPGVGNPVVEPCADGFVVMTFVLGAQGNAAFAAAIRWLEDEGVLFCLQNAGGMEHMGVRNLPFYAGTAHAYGLTYEQAVQSITLNAAKVIGVDAFCGSLETGKDATLFISEGDALDMRTNYLTEAFIQGRAIDLDNRQRQLYRKYQAKYGAPILD